jgi:hypothetical protein
MGQELTAKQICYKLNRNIPSRDIKVYGLESIGVLDNKFDISGLYDPELDQDSKQCILIEIQFPVRKPTFLFDETDLSFAHWHELAVDIASVVGHEFVHMGQFRRRHFNEGRYYRSKEKDLYFKENQEYYGMNDEIDAYAYTAAATVALEKLVYRKKNADIRKTPTYQIYRHYFRKDTKILDLLIKKGNRYYRNLERQYRDKYNKK